MDSSMAERVATRQVPEFLRHFIGGTHGPPPSPRLPSGCLICMETSFKDTLSLDSKRTRGGGGHKKRCPPPSFLSLWLRVRGVVGSY